MRFLFLFLILISMSSQAVRNPPALLEGHREVTSSLSCMNSIARMSGAIRGESPASVALRRVTDLVAVVLRWQQIAPLQSLEWDINLFTPQYEVQFLTETTENIRQTLQRLASDATIRHALDSLDQLLGVDFLRRVCFSMLADKVESYVFPVQVLKPVVQVPTPPTIERDYDRTYRRHHYGGG